MGGVVFEQKTENSWGEAIWWVGFKVIISEAVVRTACNVDTKIALMYVLLHENCDIV